jgi:hypothetical protein
MRRPLLEAALIGDGYYHSTGRPTLYCTSSSLLSSRNLLHHHYPRPFAPISTVPLAATTNGHSLRRRGQHAAGVRPPSAHSVDLLVQASLARSLVARCCPRSGDAMRAERSSCAGQPPDRGIGVRLHELASCCIVIQCYLIRRDLQIDYTCRRERCATRAPPIELSRPPEHIRRNHRNIARLYTFARCSSIGFYRKHLIVLATRAQ